MDFSRFSFSSRIAIYEAIALAKRHSHREVYPVHLALGLARLGSLGHKSGLGSRGGLNLSVPDLNRRLQRIPKTFSEQSPRYSQRLMTLFTDLSGARDGEVITEERMLTRLGDMSPELFQPFADDAAQGEQDGLATASGDSASWQPNPISPGSDLGEGSVGKGGATEGSESGEALRRLMQIFSDTSRGSEKGDKSARTGAAEGAKPTASKPNPKTPLELYTVDFTLKAAEGEFDPIGFRDHEMWRLREVLGRKKKNNPILLGEPGVGKTAIVEGLAQKLVAEDSPKRLVALDLGALLAGAKYRGDLEGRVQGLIDELQQHSDQVVLFIDEVHMLLGAGGKEGQGDLANYLKPALAAGALQCIGATTYSEYQQIIEKDPALSRRFQPILVAEPDRGACLAILRGLKERYEDYHQITISDDALVAAVALSERYLPLRQLPDKAIDLLDEACSLVKLQTEQEPREIATLRSTVEQLELELAQARSAVEGVDEFRPQAHAERSRQAVIVGVKLKQTREQLRYWLGVLGRYQSLCQARIDEGRVLAQLRRQYDAALNQQDFELAAKFAHEDIPVQLAKVQAIMTDVDRLELDHPSIAHTVSSGHVQQILHRWTGIPLSALQLPSAAAEGSGRLDVRGLGDYLEQRLYGQPEAIAAVTRTLTRSALGLTRPDQPLGVFMLVGATGLGKTHLAKLLATYLYGDSRRLIRFDMGEFQEAHSVARLLGSPPGYVGHETVGKLTQELRRYPFSVLLIDEIEKAHPQVLDVFLRLFDEGQITDSSGRQLDFTNGVVLMTSNALTLPTSPKAVPTAVQPEEDDRLRLGLRSVFRPEFVNRIDEVVLFKPLTEQTMARLVAVRLASCNEDLAKRQLRLALAPELVAALAEQAALSDDGARALERLFVSRVLDPLAKRLAYCAPLYRGWWLFDGRLWRPHYQPSTLLIAPSSTSVASP